MNSGSHPNIIDHLPQISRILASSTLSTLAFMHQRYAGGEEGNDCRGERERRYSARRFRVFRTEAKNKSVSRALDVSRWEPGSGTVTVPSM
jgi:hypothetical protein